MEKAALAAFCQYQKIRPQAAGSYMKQGYKK